MIIKYKKNKLKVELISGLAWLVFAIFYMIEGNNILLAILSSLTSILFLGQYFYNRKYQYLTIENNVVTKNMIPKRSFDLSKLNRVNRNASDDIKLISESQNDLLISTSVIDKESLVLLNSFLEKIESEIQKQPLK